MEQQIGELTDQISRLHDEANQLDQDLEENQSEKNVKYRDLRKREEAMDQVNTRFIILQVKSIYSYLRMKPPTY